MRNPRPTNSSGLTNKTFSPTSELQEAYDELRQFLTLRSNDELLLASDSGSIPAAQINDDQANTSIAISTLMSPDGAFLTKDMPTILDQMQIAPFNGETGQISINGAKNEKFGKNLFEALGLNVTDFELSNKTTRQQNQAQTVQVSTSITRLKSEIKKIRDQIKRIESSGLTDAEFARLQQLEDAPITKANREKIDSEKEALKQKITLKDDDIDKIAELNVELREKETQRDALEQQRNDTADTAARFGARDRLASVLRTDKKDIVTLYRHAGRYLDPASAASDYCNVFFNAIDSVNMSMCVPYFRMNIIDRFAKKKGRYSKLSLAAFLRQTSDATGDKIFYTAEPFTTDVMRTTNLSAADRQKLQSGKVVGMEAFFAPQTLLPDPTDLLSNPRRLDTSVPLLSLNSFSIGIESVGIALLSKKTADLSITLHDRSRLADISPLVSVGNFSSLYFEIEWGWTHPHGVAKFDNPVARYLNSLRFREIFSPTSYNMTMSEGGAMNISVRLIGGASLDAINGSVLNGGFITRAYATQILDRFIKSEMGSEAGDDDSTVDVRTITQVLIDKSRTGQMIDGEFVHKLWKYSENPGTTTKDLTDLIDQLAKVLDQSDYYKNEEILDLIKQNLPRVSKFAPVSAAPADDIFKQMKSKYGNAIEDKDFTSVAGYLTLLVGLPLAATGLYSEVQIHTFRFNDAAGRAASKQISDAPIKIADVFRNPDQDGSLYKNTSISNALTLLTNYLSNPKQPLYGIINAVDYEKVKSGNSQKSTGEPAAAADQKAKEQAETFNKPDDFVTPNIRCFIRSMPAKEYTGNQPQTISNYVINNEKPVAQIVVYDANTSPNFDKIIGAFGYSKLQSQNGDKKIRSDFAKDVFKRSFPSIVYGATNSMITSINVSTDINNAIAQQNILDVGKEIILGRSKSDASTDVGEISLFPGSVTISMIGLPIIERGQEIYLDLGTGTTLDALYYVTAVKHDFRPGEFKTNITLTYKGQGSVMSLTTMLDSFNKTLNPEKKISPAPEQPKTSTPTKTDSTAPKKPDLDRSAREQALIDDLARESAIKDAEFSKSLNTIGR